MSRRLGGAAGGKQIIHDNDALSFFNRIFMDFESVRSVFEGVIEFGCRGGKLARLAYGNKSSIQTIRKSGAEDESARFHPQNQINVFVEIVLGERVNQRSQATLVFQKRSDVIKEDASLGEIRNFADKSLQRLTINV